MSDAEAHAQEYAPLGAIALTIAATAGMLTFVSGDFMLDVGLQAVMLLAGLACAAISTWRKHWVMAIEGAAVAALALIILVAPPL